MNVLKLNNKEIDIFGSPYKIMIVDTLDDVAEEGRILFGQVDNTERIIKIAKRVNDIKQPLDQMNLTFLHELTHAILDAGQYNESSECEPLVEWIARCFHYIIKNKQI